MDKARKAPRMGIALIVIGIACIAYGVMVMMLGSGTWFFAFWYALGIVVLAAAWVFISGTWDGFPAIARHVIEGVLVVLFVGFAATQVLIMQDFNDEGEPDLDYIVVLGAQVYEWGPSVVLQHRLDAAYDYLQQNERTVCIVSGGQGFNEYTAEANVMAAYLINRGIDPSRIIIEDQAGNTEQNIEFSMQFIDPEHDRVGIVTNNFHMFRGVRIACKAGIVNVCGIAAESNPLYLPNNMVRESLGVAKDFLAGNL